MEDSPEMGLQNGARTGGEAWNFAMEQAGVSICGWKDRR